MNEYFFLYGVGLVWMLFAIIQDLRFREVSDWLNFSLIAFVLAYRAFYSSLTGNWAFFLYGVGGIVLFIGLAYLFYYGRVFAGGDAKLLMGLGGVLPITAFRDYLIVGGGFVFLLFACGALYTLGYTFFLVARNWRNFCRAIVEQAKNYRVFLIASLVCAILLLIIGIYLESLLIIYLFCILISFPALYLYVKAIEKACMIKMTNANKLTEGDWIVEDIRVGGRVIRKTVHGLSREDIALLKKYHKSVIVRDGVPFTPAFLLAFATLFWMLRYFSL